jgi:hypothetical protein
MVDAFEINDSSRVAHLGSALLDIIEINYDAELWEMIDSLDAYANNDKDAVEPPPPGGTLTGGIYFRPGSPILRNQFTLLATAPREYARWNLNGIPGNLTLVHLQEIINDLVLPTINRAIDHLAAAELGGGPRIDMIVDDEHYEIDLGEILFFDASLYAARAGFQIATAYDFDLFGPDDTYGWIDEIRDLESERLRYGRIEENADPPYDRLVRETWDSEDAEGESIAVAILQHNLENDTGFLDRRDGRMSDAYDDLKTVRDKLEQAVAAIRAEEDGQEDDIVKIANLVDLDEEIDEARDKPRFAENFTTVEDVLEWVETVMTGTYHVSEEGDHGDVEIDVNLSALFTNAPSNWTEFLPYYRFKPREDWIDWEMDYWGWPANPEHEYCYDDVDGVEHCRDGIGFVEYRDYYAEIDPIELLDGPDGDPIDLDDEKIPYFEDYTFGGLFPDSDRQSWLDLGETAGWW